MTRVQYTVDNIRAQPPLRKVTPMTDNKGLYDKFHVSRTDGDPTGKHANCGYFVLDPAHDPAAFAALECYIAAAWDERPELVGDISTWLETIQQEADHA